MLSRLETVSTLALGLALALAPAARAEDQVPPGLPSPPNLPPPASADATPPAATPARTAAPQGPQDVPPVTGPTAPPTAPPDAVPPRTIPTLLPQPLIPDLQRRSGLVSRFIPITPNLPPDGRRDQWYDTRWGDPPNIRKHKNLYFNGGLYGLRWKAECTASIAPYFYGAPGQSTLGPDCIPSHRIGRLARNLVHPFKPVGMYYDQGAYVPLYDLDPFVPGPGAWPWPFFRRLTSAGG